MPLLDAIANTIYAANSLLIACHAMTYMGDVATLTDFDAAENETRHLSDFDGADDKNDFKDNFGSATSLRVKKTRRNGTAAFVEERDVSTRSVQPKKKKQRGQDTVRNFVCADCGKRFSSAYALKRHENYHTGNKPFACLECDKSFSQQGNLNIHVAAVHEGVKYCCFICAQMLSSSTNLKHHITKTHAEYLAVQCPKCDMWMRGDLRRHQTTTTCREKAYRSCLDRTMLMDSTIHEKDSFDEDDAEVADILGGVASLKGMSNQDKTVAIKVEKKDTDSLLLEKFYTL
jgi:RNase P subunit RPR2